MSGFKDKILLITGGTGSFRNLGISFLVPYTKDFGRITQF